MVSTSLLMRRSFGYVAVGPWFLTLVNVKQGEFREDNFQKAMALVKDGEGAKDKAGRRGGTKGVGHVLFCLST